MTGDPDLDQSIDDLTFTARQMRGLEERLRTIDRVKHYKQIGRLEFERADCRTSLKTRAITLNMPWRTLLLFIEEVDRLRRKHGRRPTGIMVQNAIEAAQEFAARATLETDAALVLLHHRNDLARELAEAAAAGTAYMEASRS